MRDKQNDTTGEVIWRGASPQPALLHDEVPLAKQDPGFQPVSPLHLAEHGIPAVPWDFFLKKVLVPHSLQ